MNAGGVWCGAPALVVVVLNFICLAFFNIEFFNFPNC